MIKPGDIVTSLRSEWVWPKPTLWREDRRRHDHLTIDPGDLALAISIVSALDDSVETVVMVTVNGGIGYILHDDVRSI